MIDVVVRRLRTYYTHVSKRSREFEWSCVSKFSQPSGIFTQTNWWKCSVCVKWFFVSGKWNNDFKIYLIHRNWVNTRICQLRRWFHRVYSTCRWAKSLMLPMQACKVNAKNAAMSVVARTIGNEPIIIFNRKHKLKLTLHGLSYWITIFNGFWLAAQECIRVGQQ